MTECLLTSTDAIPLIHLQKLIQSCTNLKYLEVSQHNYHNSQSAVSLLYRNQSIEGKSVVVHKYLDIELYKFFSVMYCFREITLQSIQPTFHTSEEDRDYTSLIKFYNMNAVIKRLF